ncbi:MAG TPA: c-type cytochrome [Planctomycetota bacterium]|nr:c-type cytochrome [Planctomycetota bacterium]
MILLAVLCLQAEKPGLLLDAREGDRRVVQAVAVPAFSLGEDESLHPRLGPAFRATWTGFLKIVRAGRYTLSGDARITVGGRAAEGPLDLAPGLHPLRVEVERKPGPARLLLEWSSDHFRREPVPPTAFARHDDPPAAERRSEEGRRLAGELGCVNCHATASSGVVARRGPDLSRVGGRTNVRWLARWLEQPGAWREHAVMPVLLDRAEASDAAAFLAGLKGGPAPTAAPSDPARLARGRELFAKTGCGQCHGEGGVGLEGLGSKYEPGALRRFLLDPTAVDPGGRMPSLLLNDDEAALLAEHLVQSRNAAFEAEPPAGDPARGRALVESRGCLACHALEGAQNRRTAPPLEGLKPGGCLAPEPAKGLPRYRLDEESRAALEAFIAGGADRSASPVHAFGQLVRAYRCAACHALNESVPKGLEAYPPALTDAGHKLRPSWIQAVLLEKKRIRPWMDVRMPHFGEGVRRLAAAFPAAAGAPADAPAGRPSADDVQRGIRLVGRGEGGLSCITCHDFKGHVSLGTRGPDMVEMAARLREDWFRRWMREPIRIQPGTSMPAFFASVPEAEAERRIGLLWACLAAGRDVPLPEGIEAAHAHLVVVRDRPVVLRTYMPDASPAAIAVGLPGGVGYCFDAGDCRLLYAWSGDFLDMTPAWTGRGGGAAVPLGKRFWTAPEGFPFRVEGPPRFRGYALVDGLPEFLYEAGGLEIRQRVVARPDGLEMRFTASGPVECLLPGARADGSSIVVRVKR